MVGLEPRNEERLAEVLGLLEAGDEASLRAYVEALHPADLAEIIEELEPSRRVTVVEALPDGRAAVVLEELDSAEQIEILRDMDQARAARIVNEMSSDDLVDLLGDVHPEEAEDLLEMMPAPEAADVQELLEYMEDTAGGLMTTEFIALDEDISAEEAIAALRRLAPDAETIYYVYVVDHENRLAGVLSLRDLIVAQPETPINRIMRRDIIAVAADTDQEEVARLVAKYDFVAIPVVDGQKRLLGIVTVDDVVDVIEEEATEDVLRMGASTDEEEEGAWQRARRRLPWLLVLLFGELMAANVIKGFSITIETVTALALFIPVMAGAAGNAATQSLAVVVRGIATGEVETRRLWEVVGREARVGGLTGLVVGLVLAVTASLWQGEPGLGLLVGTVLGLNMTVATVLGGFVPVVIDRLGLDPAVASGPFITTLTDVFSMLIYFSLATIFLAYL